MKAPIFRSFLLVMLILLLFTSLTGCEDMDYRDAIRLYNDGDYEAAAEIFYALGDFEKCPELYTDCQYWIAADLAEQGNFEKALPRFWKLGAYRNSTKWVTECKYQLAIADFDEGQYKDAELAFRKMPDYKQSAEYLRRISWQSLFEEILQKGVDQISASAIEVERDGKTYIISAVHCFGDVQDLELEVYQSKNDDFSMIDDLKITLTRDSTVAQFECGSDFGMDYLDGRMGSNQLATGKIDITTCTSETKLVMETFEMHVEDNQGKVTDSTDPADSSMNDAMAENLHDLLTVIPELLLESGITVTLQDIGFNAL